MDIMIGLLGNSPFWQQQKTNDKTGALLALAALYLLLIIPLLMPFKRWMADVTCSWIGLLFLVHCVRTRDWQWLKQPVIIVLLCVWAYSALIVTPLAINVEASASRVGWIRFIIFFAALGFWLCRYTDELRRIAWVGVGFICVIMIDALVQYITGTSLSGHPVPMPMRLTGPFERPVIGIFLAKFGLPCVGLLLYHAWHSHNIRRCLALAVLIITMFSMVLLSNERTATLTLLIGLAIIGAGIFVSIKKLRIWLVLGFVLLASSVTAIQLTQPEIKARATESGDMLENFWDSPYGQLWRGAYYVFSHHPIAGVGMKNFREACNTLPDEQLAQTCKTNLHPHNIYLEFLSELGGVGFTGLLVFIATLFYTIAKEFRRSSRDKHIIIWFALATVAINFFPFAANQSFFSNWPALLAWQSLAWAVMIARSEGNYVGNK